MIIHSNSFKKIIPHLHLKLHSFIPISTKTSYTLITTISHYSHLIDNSIAFKCFSFGASIHAHLIKIGLHTHTFLANRLLHFYSKIGTFNDSMQVFDEIPRKNSFTWNVLLMGLLKFGHLEKASLLFDEMPERNVVSWNTMLCGYLQLGLFSHVIDLFTQFCDCSEISGKVQPNHITLTTVLSACAGMGALGIGARMHIIAMNNKLLLNPRVVSSLIDMYAKCGSIERALEVFYKFDAKDTYCWNVIISGLAVHGHAHAALSLFRDMKARGFNPDDVTFLSLLSACSHEGLVEEGSQLFARMENEFGVIPRSEHYGCMVDLLGRAGFVHSAFRLIETMPFQPEETAWGALLSACITHQDFEIGEMVAKRMASDLESFGDGQYMMLANFYALCGKWDDANRWRMMMNKSGIYKTAGYSIIEVDGRMFKFLAGDGDSYQESLQE